MLSFRTLSGYMIGNGTLQEPVVVSVTPRQRRQPTAVFPNYRL